MTLQPCETVQLLREISYMAVRILTPSAWQSDVFAPELRTSAYKTSTMSIESVPASVVESCLMQEGSWRCTSITHVPDRSAEKVGATLGKDSIWGGCVG